MPDVSSAHAFSPLSSGMLAIVLFCAGLALGWLVARRRTGRTAVPHPGELQRLTGLLAPLVDWTRDLAEDMAQYRAVVCGISQLFRDSPDALAGQRQRATASLLGQVVEANEQLQKRLNAAEHMLKEQASEISVYMSEARTDSLTGLPNRRAFDEELARRLSAWRRARRPLSIVMVDIDQFKRFNDLYGHQTGDEVLCHVARLLKDTMRQSDFVARFGGEEMAVVMPDTDMPEACRAAERAREAVETAHLRGTSDSWCVTVSLGAAQCGDVDTSVGLLKRADQALYAAKRAGRNRTYWHDGTKCVPVAGQEQLPDDQLPDADVDQPAASFSEICRDLRRRMEQVAVATSPDR